MFLGKTSWLLDIGLGLGTIDIKGKRFVSRNAGEQHPKWTSPFRLAHWRLPL
jgi:hypothetical protein